MNDKERFTTIFVTYHRAVTAYVRRRVPPDAVPDIVADVFLAGWRHLDKLNDQPLAWLYRAAALEIAHQRRGLNRDESLWDLAARAPWSFVEDDPAGGVSDRDQWGRAFSSLAEADREVLRLVAWEDLTPQQVAKVLGCTVVAYRVRLHRARQRLSMAVEHSTPASKSPQKSSER